MPAFQTASRGRAPLVPALLAALVLPLAAQEASEAEEAKPTHDLRLSCIEGRPVLVDHEARVQATAGVPGSDRKRKIDFESKWRVVDTYTTVDAEKKLYVARREYVRTEEDHGGRAQDPPLTSHSILFIDEDGKERLEIAGDRQLPKDLIQQLFLSTGTLGAWVSLPSEAEVGASYPIGCASLMCTVLDHETWPQECVAKLELKSVDTEKRRAVLEGPLAYELEEEDGGLTMTNRYEGTVRMEIDLEERLLSKFRFEGRLKGEGLAGSTPIEVEGRVEATLEATAGKKAESALRARPRHRDVPRAPDGHPFHFELPSHWFFDEEDDGLGAGYLTDAHRREGETGNHVVFVRAFPSPTPEEAAKEAAESVAKDTGGKLRRVRARKLGRGYSVSAKGASGNELIYDFLPAKGYLVRVIWSAGERLERDGRACRKTLLKTLEMR